MKNIFHLFFLLILLKVQAQPTDYIYASRKAKAEFFLQEKAEKKDYTRAKELWEALVQIFPNKAEAKYFLGYTLDRINVADGSRLPEYNLALATAASEQFEAVNRITPKYNGELIVLDPYSKISSIWSSKALAYLVTDKKDSAVWAFKEGKKRGGFLDPILEMNRQMMHSCKKDAILFTTGDNVSFTCYYLQNTENCRKDITIIDVSLLDANWYIQFLQKNNPGLIYLTENEINQLNYQIADTAAVHITHPFDRKKQFTWNIQPSYGKYFSIADQIMVILLSKSIYQKPIYFSSSNTYGNQLNLTKFLVQQGLVQWLNPEGENRKEVNPLSLTENFPKYLLHKKAAAILKLSVDAQITLNQYRVAYKNTVEQLMQWKMKNEAKKLVRFMQNKYPESILPFIPLNLKTSILTLEKQVLY